MSKALRSVILLSACIALFGCHKAKEPQGSATNAETSAVKALEVEEANKQLIRNWAAELNKSNLAYLDQVIHPDFVDHNPFPNVPPTKAGYISTLTKAHKEWFPGIQIEVQDVLAGGDKIAFRVGVKAKHVGNVMGAPGTGKEIAWEAYGIYRVKDGMLIERWEMLDSFAFMSQLGLAKLAQ